MTLPVMEQNDAEFASLLNLLRRERLRSILEVGVFQGGTLRRFRDAFPNACIVGIDPRPMIQPEHAPVWNPMPTVVTGCSQDRMVRQRAESLNGGERFDFAFIDGDHSYGGVSEDWEWAQREVLRIVAFHDIHSEESCPDVVRFWKELTTELRGRDEFHYLEITHEEKRNGIGVVWL